MVMVIIGRQSLSHSMALHTLVIEAIVEHHYQGNAFCFLRSQMYQVFVIMFWHHESSQDIIHVRVTFKNNPRVTTALPTNTMPATEHMPVGWPYLRPVGWPKCELL